MGETGERGPPGRGPKGLPGATGLPGKCGASEQWLVANEFIG